jgi:hypothetical protein
MADDEKPPQFVEEPAPPPGMPIVEALGLVKKRFPKAFEAIQNVLGELAERIELEQKEAHAAFATVKAALQEGSGHLWGCPYALQQIAAKTCKNISCQRVQHILAIPTVAAFLARAHALETLVQQHVRHDPLCTWWKTEGEATRPCSCGLTEMVAFYSEAL